MVIYKMALSARVMATHEAPRVEVPKPHSFSGNRDAKELDNYQTRGRKQGKIPDARFRRPVSCDRMTGSTIADGDGEGRTHWHDKWQAGMVPRNTKKRGMQHDDFPGGHPS